MDVLAEGGADTGAIVSLAGARTFLNVPMLKDDELVGVVAIYRQEVRPFTDKQIELVKNFAAQAVVAIENTRLLNELRQRTDDLSESLEQQTATSDVLQVISSSTGDLAPVFEAILANAARICEAKLGNLLLLEGDARSEGDALRVVALHGAPPSYAEERRRVPVIHPDPGTMLGRALTTKRPVQVADIRVERDYPDSLPSGSTGAKFAKLAGARTVLAVPMLKESELVGAILIYRREVRPFTDKQIELVENFAAQAVIAIENTRLLNELREALEQQTATSDVLQVISSSPGQLEPVFQAMLSNAVRVCEAKFGVLLRYSDGAFHTAATLDVPPAYAEFLRRGSFRPDVEPTLAGSPLHRLLLSKEIVQSDDVSLEDNPGPAGQHGGARSYIAVPLRKESELVGVFVIYRQEVRPFTDKQTELVKAFANQAVIAIENARLLNELRESLQQQTATAEVLQVISSSPGELEPVFDTLLANAVRICEAKLGTLVLCENDGFRHVAGYGAPLAYVELRQREPVIRPGPDAPLRRVAETRKVVHVLDLLEEPSRGKLATLAGARSQMLVPMLN